MCWPGELSGSHVNKHRSAEHRFSNILFVIIVMNKEKNTFSMQDWSIDFINKNCSVNHDFVR